MHLVDFFGRKITDLRISITDRCNFHCSYCHNEGQGPVRLAGATCANELTKEEIVRIVRIAREFEITQAKLSGGEPLVRRDCEEIVAALAPIVMVSMVTNGSMLAERVDGLKAAGLARLNVSIDSMEPGLFHEVRSGSVRPVLSGIHRALDAGIRPIKLNMVVCRETVDGIEEMLGFVRGHDGLRLQLIQYMPEIAGRPERGVDMSEVKRWLEQRADKVEMRKMHHRRIYFLAGARVEVVDPVGNEEFCANCQRLRVTAKGGLKSCLNRDDDVLPLRGLDDSGIRDAFRKIVAGRMPYYPTYLRTRRGRSPEPSPRPEPS